MIPILSVMVLVCEVMRRKGHLCGIPVQLWVELVFVTQLIYEILTVNELWIVRWNKKWFIPMRLVLCCTLMLAYSSLTVWGYAVIFTDFNDCKHNTATLSWLILMIVFLILSTFALLISCFLLD